MQKYKIFALTLYLLAGGGGVYAQSASPDTRATPQQLKQKATAVNVPEIAYASVPDFLKLPPGLYLGEAMGVATNSAGHVFVFTRSGATRLFEFDADGNYVREIGHDLYGFVFAHAVRVDRDDNIWTVDEGSNTVIKFNPRGRVEMIIGRRPQAVYGVPAVGNERKALNPEPKPYELDRPTDVGFDAEGNIFVSDGYNNSRVVKYDRDGHFLAQVGTRGKDKGQLDLPHSLQVDNQGNVYVADRSNNRIQVFDNALKFKAIYDNVGQPWTLCISPGKHQYLYSSNSYPDSNNSVMRPLSGEIYKMELNGKILGKFGKPGKKPGEFSTTHGIDCRNENEIYVSEITSWRVQKIVLKTANTAREHGRAHGSASTHTPTPMAVAVAAPAAAVASTTQQDFLRLPDDIYFGEVAGVATSSKGHIYVYTRTGSETMLVGAARAFVHGGSRLFDFDSDGRYVGEIGQGIYGFLSAHAVRVDADDNIWAVDEGSSVIMKFAPDGGLLMTLGRKPESIAVPAANPRPNTGLGIPGDTFNRPTDIAWDRNGNIFVADGSGNARIVKLAADGTYIKAWGGRGSGPGQFNDLHTIAVDAAGNVYAGDRGNSRIQVFDNDGTFKHEIRSVGVPHAICITPGPHQYLYSSNSNSPDSFDHGEIYKLELDGTIVGQFGKAGHRPGEFSTVHAIDCRDESHLLVGEVGAWRVQRVSVEK